jgi:hypothetical protein
MRDENWKWIDGFMPIKAEDVKARVAEIGAQMVRRAWEVVERFHVGSITDDYLNHDISLAEYETAVGQIYRVLEEMEPEQLIEEARGLGETFRSLFLSGDDIEARLDVMGLG